MYAPIKIAIADDHEIFREGFKLLMNNKEELELVGEAENGKELLDIAAKMHPDIIITDIKMPVMDGIEVCRIVCKKFPEMKVIALSMFNEDNLIVDMLEAGARGYLLKNTNKAELLLAAKTVHGGNSYYCNATTDKLAKMIAESKFNPYRNHPDQKFTKRELEIIQLVCQQFSNKEIANSLKLGLRTVESYRETIQKKTGSRNTAGVVIYAIRNRLFQA